MAHLEVEPKPSRSWWIWLLVAIIIIALGATLLNKCGTERKDTIPLDTVNSAEDPSGPA